MFKSLYLLILLFTFVLCISCNSDNPKNDSDIVSGVDTENDTDSVQDTDLADSFVKPDADETDPDADVDEAWERDIEIPDMSGNPYWEEYSDSDKNIAYYYYGDKPVKASDPENVKALWSKKCGGDLCFECESAPYDLCAENYPFEAQIINGPHSGSRIESVAGEFQCDALLTPGKWYTSEIANSVRFNEIDSKVIYSMANGTTSWQGGGTYVYNIDTRKVERIGRGYLDGWQNSRYYFVSTIDNRIDIFHEESPYYGPKQRHFLYYEKEENKYGYALKFSETPSELVDVRASETYLFMSAYFGGDASDMRILYTKIGEWDKWKELTYKKDTLFGGQRRAGYPSMIDSYVVYFDYDIQIQFCDLEKGDAGCFKVSKDDEYGRYPIFKDKNTVIYASQETTGDKKSKIVVADITDKQNIKYATIYEGDGSAALGSYDVSDKYVLIKRRYIDPQNAEEEIHDYCMYRFSDGKTVCFDEPFDLEFRKDEGYIYKNKIVFRSYMDLVVRDLECYCDLYPSKCPLSDYTPNTENPKKPWSWDWKPSK
jgi:hypothetical protein